METRHKELIIRWLTEKRNKEMKIYGKKGRIVKLRNKRTEELIVDFMEN